MPDRPPPHALRFGDFDLDVLAYELRRRGQPVKIERLAMDLLILLVEQRDRLVTRNEIVERLWGPDVFLEVDASVNTLVRKLRRALGDAVDEPRFIQTVQGKGYRFIAAVEAAAAIPHVAPDVPVSLPQPVAKTILSGRQRIPAVLVLVVLLVAVALGARLAWSRLAAGSAGVPIRVAVMPFENLTGDPEREYLADGLTEETAASLGQIIDSGQATVIGRVSTRTYKGTQKSAEQIGRELSATYLVVGSIRADRDRLHITSNLVRVADQVQVWSYSYDRQPVSILAMQQELGSAVAREVHLQLSPHRIDALAQRQTQNADAYDFYLKGRYLWNQLTPPTTKLALESYARATALDPNYALAWSGIADALTTGPIMGDADPRAVRGPARHAAQRALAAGETIAEAQTSAAVEKFFLEWDWGAAEAGLRRAIQIDGSYAMAHRMLGVVLSHSGRHDEARAAMERAKVLEPAYAMNHALSAMVEFHSGDIAAAVMSAQQAFAYEPDFWIANYHLGQAYEQQGRHDLAIAAFAASARGSRHGNSKPLSVSAYVLAKMGRANGARAVLTAFDERAATRYVPPYARAIVYAGLGDRDAAFEWLEKALEVRDVHLIFLPVDPKWNALRQDPRFTELLRRCAFSSAPRRG